MGNSMLKLSTCLGKSHQNEKGLKDDFHIIPITVAERSGSVVECLTRDRGAAGSNLTGVTALCP